MLCESRPGCPGVSFASASPDTAGEEEVLFADVPSVETLVRVIFISAAETPCLVSSRCAR